MDFAARFLGAICANKKTGYYFGMKAMHPKKGGFFNIFPAKRRNARRLRGGRLFVYCIKYGRFGELNAHLRKFLFVDSKGSYGLFFKIPIDKFSTGCQRRSFLRGDGGREALGELV